MVSRLVRWGVAVLTAGAIVAMPLASAKAHDSDGDAASQRATVTVRIPPKSTPGCTSLSFHLGQWGHYLTLNDLIRWLKKNLGAAATAHCHGTTPWLLTVTLSTLSGVHSFTVVNSDDGVHVSPITLRGNSQITSTDMVTIDSFL